MPNQTYRQNAFNAGEFSPRLKGRSDFNKYASGLQTCNNAIALVTGGVTKRPGFHYINSAKYTDRYVELVPFEFSEDQAYVLEFGDLYMRVFADGGRVTSPDANTLLLLHADGVDKSIDFEDSGVNLHTVSAYGNAQIDTAQYFFPSASALFQGTSDYLSIPDHANWNFGAAEFTIDFRVRFFANEGISTFYMQKDATDGDHIIFLVDHEQGQLHFQVVDTGAIVVNESATWAPSVDTWYHVALVRGWGGAVDDWAICIDGAAILTFTDAGVMPNHDQALLIGCGPGTGYLLDYVTGKDVDIAGGAVVSTVAPHFGSGSLACDGTDDYITLADHADWHIGNQANATVMVWYKHKTNTGTDPIWSQSTDVNNRQFLYRGVSDELYFFLITAGTNRVYLSSATNTVQNTTWHCAVVSKVVDQWGLYLDGVLKSTFTCAALASDFTGGFFVGALAGPTYGDIYVDEVLVTHDNHFGADPAAFLTDSSTAAHGVILCNAATTPAPLVDTTNKKFGASSIYFDGANNYVYYADHADWDWMSQADATIDFWVKHIDHAGDEEYVNQYQDANNYWLIAHSHGVGLNMQYMTGGVMRLIMQGGEITNTNWHHVAFCKVGAAFGMYLDGVQVGYATTAVNTALAQYLAIGFLGSAGGQYFQGNIDEFQFTHLNKFSAAPVVGLTDTITVPAAQETSPGASVKLLLNFDSDNIGIPTAHQIPVAANAKLHICPDIADHYGWLDEYRVSDTARWTADFTPATQEYPAGGGGTVYEIVTPYSQYDVSLLRGTQSADTLFLFHPDYPPQQLTRTSHTAWSIAEVEWREPPWNDVNTTATTLDPDATAIGAVNIAASAPLFTDLHVGAYFKQANGYYQIDTVTNSTTAVGTIIATLDDHNATATWYQGCWDDTQGYPTMGCFHEDRLVLIGDAAHPLKVFLSESGNYTNLGELSAPVVDTDPLAYEIWAEKQNQLKWVRSAKKLILGTVGAEFWMTGATADEPITPTSILVRRESTYGAEGIMPVTIGSHIIFSQRGGRTVRLWGYNADTDAFVGEDLGVLAEHMTKDTTILKMEYAQDPSGIVWMTLGNGYLMGLTYQRQHEVVGFHIHDTPADGLVESIAVIPGTTCDELWALICRQIGGVDARYIERLDPLFFGGTLASQAIFTDSCLTYAGAAAVTFAGLDHLEGETVQVLADGIHVADEVVASGEITLTTAASLVCAGLGYNMNVKTLTPDIAGDKVGNVGNLLKRIVEVLFQVYDTSTFKFGRDSSNLLTKTLTSGSTVTGEYLCEFNGEFTYYPSIYIRQDAPLPITLLSLVYKLELEDD